VTQSVFATPPNPLAIAAARLRTGGKSTYYDDPAGFAKHCIQWPKDQGLTSYQDEVMTALARERRAAVRGPHGLGKTTTNALIILWFSVTRDQAGVDWKIATTAGAWRQLDKYLWPEVHKWAKRLRTDMIGLPRFNSRTELLSLNLKLNHGQAFAVASDDPELIEGVHADEVLYIFDESKAISPATFDAAEGAFSGDGQGALAAYALATSTPGAPNGRFYDIHARKAGFEDWWTRHVTDEECMDAGRMSASWKEARGRQWGTDSSVYANRVLGEFHADDENGIIPLAWVEAANERWRAWVEDGRPPIEGGPRTVGVDVARSGSDNTVLALRDGDCITELRKYSKKDTMETTGNVKGVLDENPRRVAIVDVIGVGGGVVDRLREQKLNVEAFNASESTDMKDRSGELGFNNTRSAAWWKMRELLDPAYGSKLMLPDDDLLTGDLCTPTWRVLSGGKIQVEPKDDIKKRISRSTDDGDAVVQAFWDGADHSAEAWSSWQRKRAETAAAATEAASVITGPTDRQTARQAAFAEAASRR
jgi:hypothetical protein